MYKSLAREILKTAFAMTRSFTGEPSKEETETIQHSRRVARMAERLLPHFAALDTRFYRTEHVSRAAAAMYLHDIGKALPLVLDPSMLSRRPKRPDGPRWKYEHPGFGRLMLPYTLYHLGKKLSPGFREDAEKVIFEHHEQYSGKGYPQKLSGEQISLIARVTAPLDYLDARITRIWHNGTEPKEPLSVDKALEEIDRRSGTQFDPKVVNMLLRYFTQSNPGT